MSERVINHMSKLWARHNLRQSHDCMTMMMRAQPPLLYTQHTHVCTLYVYAVHCPSLVSIGWSISRRIRTCRLKTAPTVTSLLLLQYQ